MEVSTPRFKRGFGVHKPRSSSAVRESRFTAADLGGRKVEELPVAEATFFLAPFIRMSSFEGEWDCHTARARLIGVQKVTIDFRGRESSPRPTICIPSDLFAGLQAFLHTQPFRQAATKPLYFSVYI